MGGIFRSGSFDAPFPAAWSVKTRRDPSRRCRDARVYGHITTGMHDNEYTPPLSSFPSSVQFHREHGDETAA